MQTFDPNAMKPAFLKAIEATRSAITARKVSAKLAMLKDVEAEMEPLTGKDDLTIKTSKTSIIAFNRMMNKFLFNRGIYHGIEFSNLDDFESKITTQDKEILVALLLDASYTKLPKRTAYCPECGELTEYDLTIADIFSNPATKIPVWDYDEPVYEKIFSETMFDGVLTVNVKAPTEAKKNSIYDSMTIDNIRKNLIEKGDMMDSTDTLMMFIDSLVIKHGKETFELKNPVTEVRPYLDNAPLEIHDAINDYINETFNKYIVDFKAPVVCDKCGHKFDQSISPESEFFRKAFSI